MADKNESETHGHNLGDLNEDAGHIFDQTNDVVDGLQGNADDPEQVEKRQDEAPETDPDA